MKDLEAWPESSIDVNGSAALPPLQWLVSIGDQENHHRRHFRLGRFTVALGDGTPCIVVEDVNEVPIGCLLGDVLDVGIKLSTPE